METLLLINSKIHTSGYPVHYRLAQTLRGDCPECGNPLTGSRCDTCSRGANRTPGETTQEDVL